MERFAGERERDFRGHCYRANPGTILTASFPYDTSLRRIQSPKTGFFTMTTGYTRCCAGHRRVHPNFEVRRGRAKAHFDCRRLPRSKTRLIASIPEFELCGEAGNGREGIERAQELKPDLIVLDLSMPVMNGFDAARELKVLMPSVPILMYTSFVGTNVANEALAAGVSMVASKATPRAVLVEDLRTLLKRAS